MIQRVEEHNRALPPARRIRTSVEVEKPREELLPLLAHGDVVRPATPQHGLVRWGWGRGYGAGPWIWGVAWHWGVVSMGRGRGLGLGAGPGAAPRGSGSRRGTAGPWGGGRARGRALTPPQVFISKDLAKHFGYRSAPEALRGLRGRVQPG